MAKNQSKTNEESSSATIDSIVTWFKSAVVAFVVALVALAIIGYVAKRDFQEQRNRDNAQDAAQLASRIKESCLNYNRDKTVDRIAAHEKIFALAKLSGREVDENTLTDEQKARIAEYDARMAQLYAYRHCDPACAVSYTSKDIPDCPPSDNEEGT